MDTNAGESAESANPGLPLVAIAPEGDVIFVVGDEQRRLRVHSVFLRTVSSVFNAMLGPHYREGANLSCDHPEVILLPDDDPESMEIIFNTIHFRMGAVKERFEPEDVLCLAIATDKYDLTQALRLSIRDWLQCDGGQDPQKLWQLAKAAYLLRNDKAFEATTLGLLYHYGGSYYQLDDTETTLINFECRFASMMEERRGRLRLEVVCRAARSDLQTKGKRRVAGSKLDPARISTISLYDSIKYLLAPPVDEVWGYEHSLARTSADDLVREVTKEYITQGLGGLCLTCVRTGEDHQDHSEG